MNNYSHSKCPKCEHTSFELAEDAPLNATHKLYYIRCTSCKTIVGALPYLDTNALIQKLAKGLRINLG